MSGYSWTRHDDEGPDAYRDRRVRMLRRIAASRDPQSVPTLYQLRDFLQRPTAPPSIFTSEDFYNAVDPIAARKREREQRRARKKLLAGWVQLYHATCVDARSIPT